MRRSTRLVLALAVVAMLAAVTAEAATQLYVVPPLKYRGHWVFNTAKGANGSIVVQNTGAAATNFTIQFAAAPLVPTPDLTTVTIPPIFGNLAAGQIRQFDFALPHPVKPLSFIRIRPVP
jgi:hypothetical protein